MKKLLFCLAILLPALRKVRETTNIAICASNEHQLTLNTKDPGYALPLRAVRELEDEGAIGKIHNTYYATTGNQTAVTAAKRMGGEIGRELLEQHVDAVLLVAT